MADVFDQLEQPDGDVFDSIEPTASTSDVFDVVAGTEGGGVGDYVSGALGAFADVGYATLEGAAALLGQVTGDNDLARNVSDFREYSKQFYTGDVPEDTKEKLSYKVTEAMGQLPAYIASGAAKIPGLIALGVNAFQQGRDDYLRTMGVTTENATDEQIQEANKIGGITAVPLMALERFGAGKIVNSIFKEGTEITAKEALKRIGSASLAEGLTEGTQTALQNTIAGKLAQYDPNRLVSQGVVESMIIGAIASGGFTAPTNATMVAANKLSGGIRQGEINPEEMGTVETNEQGNPTIEGNLKKTVWDNPENIPIVGTSKAKDVGFVANAKQLANKLIEPISAQMKKLSPRLAGELRRLEGDIGRKTNQRILTVKPFIQKLDKLEKSDPQKYNQLSQMLFNGAASDTEARNAMLQELGMFEEFQDVQKVLGDSKTQGSIYADAEQVGMKQGGNKQYFMGYLQDYFPRMVQDYKGLQELYGKDIDMTMFDQEIAARERETGKKIGEHEKGILLESFIKGDMHQRVGSPRPQSTKKRVTDALSPDALQFYMKPQKSLAAYIENMTTATETKRFLGINDMLTEEGRERVPGRMAQVLQEEYQNKTMTAEKERQIRDLIKARFGAKDAQNKIITGAKNLGYMATMGNVGSAITQLGDFYFTVVQNGLLPSIRAATGKKVFRLPDIGIDRDQVTIEAQEGPQTLQKAVDFVFKASGLSQLDRFAKETNINAAFQNAQKMARGKGEKALRGKVATLFDNNIKVTRNGKPTGLGEVDQFIADVKAGKSSDLVAQYLFNQISEVAPVSLSEMPPAYAANPNFRILYQLKSYTVKQFNFMRENAFSKMRQGVIEGNTKLALEGLKNLIYMGSVMMAANATADVLKDFIFGREIDPDDIWVDNLLRIFGMSRYLTRKARKDPASAVTALFAPPQLNILNDIAKDAMGSKDLDDLRTMKYVPLIGKFYYWHEGRGQEMERKYRWSD